MIHNRMFVLGSLLSFLLMLAYVIYLGQIADPRLEGEGLTPDLMHWWEILHWLSLVVSLPILMLASFYSAFKQREYKWLFVMFFCWPLFFAYAFRNSA